MEVESGRILHTGQVIPKYVAGSITHEVYLKNPASFAKCVESAEDAEKLLLRLVEAKKNSPLQYTTLALAIVAKRVPRDDNFRIVRNKICEMVPQILTNTEELMSFNRYAKLLELKKGSFWISCMRSFYSNCDERKLIDDLINRSHNKIHGWSHRQVFDLIHAPSLSDIHELFSKYVYKGIESLSSFERNENISGDVVAKIKCIDNLKKCDTVDEAIDIISNNEFIKYSHIPKNVQIQIKKAKAWKIVIKRMTVEEVLIFINGISTFKRIKEQIRLNPLTHSSSIVSEIEKILSKHTASPIRAFITYCNYTKMCSFANEEPRTVELKEKIDPKREESNESVRNKLSIALTSLVERSIFAVEKNIDARCLVILDMEDYMFTVSKKVQNTKKVEGTETQEEANIDEKPAIANVEYVKKSAKCYYNRNVTPADAAIFLALYFLKRVANTDIAVFANKDIEKVEFDPLKIPSFQECEKKLRLLNVNSLELNKPFDWAVSNNQNIDLFIIITDSASRPKKKIKIYRQTTRDVKTAFNDYRLKTNMPKSKCAVVSLSSHQVVTSGSECDGILDIAGFDENVPKIIENFFFERFY